MNDEPSVPLFHQQQINAVGWTLRSGLSKGANIDSGAAHPLVDQIRAHRQRPFERKAPRTRGWFPACRWRSPGPPAEYSHPAANVPRCRSAGGCRRARGFARCHPGRQRGTPFRRGGRRGAGSGPRSPPGAAVLPIAAVHRQARHGGDHRRFARRGGRYDGSAELDAFGRRNVGTVGRRLWNRAGGEIGRRAGVKARRRRDRTSAGTDRTRDQSGIGRNGQRAVGGRGAVPWKLAA